MIEGIPKISVLVICYNQENVISRAIDSLLAQKDYIYEICVSDDCSKDRTWEILQEYSRQYPGLFVLNRNEPNVGIFENIEKTWTMPTGDLVYRLAGDDECGESWFHQVITYINDNKIDYKNELFTILGDYRAIYPNGDSMIFRNNLILTSVDPVYLFLRTVIGNRSACFSKNILKKHEKVSQGRSHIAESAIDIQLAINTEKFYYIPYVGNLYYANVGISRNTSSDEYFQERNEILPYALSFLEQKDVKVDSRINDFLKSNIAEKTFLHQKSMKNFCHFIFSKLLSYDSRIGLKSLGFKPYLFSIIRKIKHKNPLIIKV